MSGPELIAHRGYAHEYPENTLIAVAAAVAAGARFVEVDVQLSQDRIPVLFHDRTLNRLCGVDGAVHERSWAQLRALRAAEFARFGYKFADNRLTSVHEFAQFLRAHPHVTAFVEIKRIAVEQFGIDVVLDCVSRELAGLDAQVVLISFSLEVLAAARRRPQHARGWHALGAVIDTWRERLQPAILRLAPEYLFCDVDGLPRWRGLRFGHARVAIYEVADAALAQRLHRRGAALIETFAIRELAAALELAGGRAQ